MAFESLSEKLQNTFKKIRGKGVLTENDINDAMREVKLALLEADVNFKIVKEFVADVKEKCLGQEVLQSLTPGQQVIKIVNDQLTELMGGTGSKLTYSPSGFTVLLMVGLQGTGKTTTCGKLALYLKKEGKKPSVQKYRRMPNTEMSVQPASQLSTWLRSLRATNMRSMRPLRLSRTSSRSQQASGTISVSA